VLIVIAPAECVYVCCYTLLMGYNMGNYKLRLVLTLPGNTSRAYASLVLLSNLRCEPSYANTEDRLRSLSCTAYAVVKA